jgi:hypothetical protein
MRLPVLIASAALVLTGCYADDQEPRRTRPTTPPSATATATTPAVVLTLTGCTTGPGGKADRSCDPGVLNPDVTPATLRTTICRPNWTDTVRPPTSYTNQLKRLDMTRYGIPHSEVSSYRYDHLVALTLGGHPTDPGNLWPQHKGPAVDKNTQAVRLKNQVCRGEITLPEAQRTLLDAWSYQR